MLFSKALTSGDLDGDGDLDIIARGGKRLGWYKNLDGQAKYGKLQVIEESPISSNNLLFILDVDDDGDNDIISSGNNANTLTWYENIDSNGQFGSPILIDTTTNILEFDMGDINNDGNEDIIITGNLNGSSVFWYENDGISGFLSAQIVDNNSVPSSKRSIKLRDMDNDGDLDILFSYGSLLDPGEISWYENTDGQGSFSSRNNIGSIIDNNYAELDAGDTDNDGNMDIVIQHDNTEIALYNDDNGDGTFSPSTLIPLDITTRVRSIELVDIDNDNDLDILTLLQGSGSFGTVYGWYENIDGLGSYSTLRNIESYTYGTNPSGFVTSNILHCSDLNNDGEKDVVLAFSISGRGEIITYLNDGAENYTNTKTIISGYSESARSIIMADVDGDNDLDIVTGSYRIHWYENVNGLGYCIRNGLKSDFNGDTNIGYILSITATDVDDDNDVDIIATTTNSIYWYENIDGLGTFSNGELIDSHGSFSEIATVDAKDVDNDGDNDIIVGDRGENSIYMYFNTNGLGAFSAAQVITNQVNYVSSVKFVDVNNDGNLDILSASVSDDKIAWFENLDGLGSFGAENIVSTTINGAFYSTMGDIDNDGLKDIVASSLIDDKIIWFKGLDGLGNFSNENPVASSIDNARKVDVKDMDNDGDLDVVYLSRNNNQLLWSENIDGQGTFGTPIVINDNFFTSDFITSELFDVNDLDNNGMLDIITLSTIPGNGNGTRRIVFHKNLGIFSNNISGRVSLDANANGCDISDEGIPNLLVISNNGNNSFSTFTDTYGFYSISANDNVFNVAISSELPNYYVSNPLNHMIDFTNQNNTNNTANFCVQANQAINDLVISLYASIDEPRPGFDTTYRIVCKNTGTTPLSGDITFEFDSTKVQFLNASETINTQTANTLTFNYSNLNPFETRTIDLEFNVFAPPTTNIGDILVSTATINPISGDNTEEDNVFELEQTVVGSYDPNDISVVEGEEILIEDADKYLHYLIRFQNTGTASAINVNIENILDTNLDWTTMQLESLSHSGRVEITDGNMVKFIFEDIYLPDSTSDEPNSHGYIAYKIKPKSTVTVGDIMYNTADIFFDFNPPITTNTVSTEIVEPLSVGEFENNRFSIYPNPTKDIIHVNGKEEIKKLSILDLNGRLLNEINYARSQTTAQISMSDYQVGLYFLSIETEKSIYTHKIIKQ